MNGVLASKADYNMMTIDKDVDSVRYTILKKGLNQIVDQITLECRNNAMKIDEIPIYGGESFPHPLSDSFPHPLSDSFPHPLNDKDFKKEFWDPKGFYAFILEDYFHLAYLSSWENVLKLNEILNEEDLINNLPENVTKEDFYKFFSVLALIPGNFGVRFLKLIIEQKVSLSKEILPNINILNEYLLKLIYSAFPLLYSHIRHKILAVFTDKSLIKGSFQLMDHLIKSCKKKYGIGVLGDVYTQDVKDIMSILTFELMTLRCVKKSFSEPSVKEELFKNKLVNVQKRLLNSFEKIYEKSIGNIDADPIRSFELQRKAKRDLALLLDEFYLEAADSITNATFIKFAKYNNKWKQWAKGIDGYREGILNRSKQWGHKNLCNIMESAYTPKYENASDLYMHYYKISKQCGLTLLRFSNPYARLGLLEFTLLNSKDLNLLFGSMVYPDLTAMFNYTGSCEGIDFLDFMMISINRNAYLVFDDIMAIDNMEIRLLGSNEVAYTFHKVFLNRVYGN